MKTKLFSVLQRIGRSFMLPIAVLPIAGIFLGIGSCLTNETTIATLELEHILGDGTILNAIFMIMSKVGNAIFTNLPIIFAASVALGMSKKEKEVAVLSAIIAFLVMHTTINGILIASGSIVDGQIASSVLEGTISNVCGIQSLEMGVFGGIIVGLGVSYLHNRFYRIQLPSVLSFFEGTRFVPVISALVFFLVGFLMYFIWPFVQNGIYSFGQFISNSGYLGTFAYGIIKRLLLPFGLHHVFYLPFWQTAVGGAMEVQGTMVFGGQNIFFAQLADPSVIHFSSNATRYFSGEFIFMIFGLPGAALAMYQSAKSEHKKVVGSLLFSAALTSMLTGITEPIEFAFLFVAPMLYGVQVLLAGSAYMIAHICNISIGLTFSGGLIDFIVFGVFQGNAKTSWMLVIPLGILYFFLYYISFKFLIAKFDLKTPGREDIMDVSVLKKNQKVMSATIEKRNDDYVVDTQAKLLVKGLGGRNNFSDYDSCITRVRVTIIDNTKVNESILKQSGAAAIVMQGNGIQIIYGPKASTIKSNLDEYLYYVQDDGVDDIEDIDRENVFETFELYNIVDGEVLAVEQSCDQLFANKLLGDGIMVKPSNGIIVSPCDGVVRMIYPTKHAIGLELDNGCEILIHFGTDTVNLNGVGFELFVKVKQRVKKGDLIWKADLPYIIEHAVCENITIVFTKLTKKVIIEKEYGAIKQGDSILKVYEL